MKLKNGLALGPGEMLHIGRPEAKRSGRHCPSGCVVKLFTHTDIEGSGYDGHMLYLWGASGVES